MPPTIIGFAFRAPYHVTLGPFSSTVPITTGITRPSSAVGAVNEPRELAFGDFASRFESTVVATISTSSMIIQKTMRASVERIFERVLHRHPLKAQEIFPVRELVDARAIVPHAPGVKIHCRAQRDAEQRREQMESHSVVEQDHPALLADFC